MKKIRTHPDRVMLDGLEHVNSKVLAPMINLTEYYIRRLANEGRLPGRKVNSKWWFYPPSVIDYLKAHDRLNPIPVNSASRKCEALFALPPRGTTFDPAAGL